MRATPPLRAATFPHGASGVALIIYQFSGRQRYTAGSREFSLSGGQMLLVPPGCACSTGACPLEKGSSAWLLVGVNSLEAGPSVERQWGESMVMKHLLIPSGPGTFLMEAGSRELIGVVFDAWDRHSHMLVREMVRNCVATLMVGAAMRVTGAETGDARNENDFRIQRVLKWMDETQDFEVCRDKLTNISGLSASGFHYHFKRVTGSSPMDYWLRLRVERAAQRLREQPDLTITRVAHEFGFSSSQYFATVFRRYLGSSPQTHREAAPQGA